MNIYCELTCVFETYIVLSHDMFDILGFVLRIWFPFIPPPTTHPVSRELFWELKFRSVFGRRIHTHRNNTPLSLILSLTQSI